MTQDEKEIAEAKKDIAEKGKDSQTKKDRIDESVGEQEKRSGNENSQNAKDRVDGTKKADEKRAEEKRENKGDERLDRLITAIEGLVTAMKAGHEAREEKAEDKLEASKAKYGMSMGSAGESGSGKKFTVEDVKKLLG